MSTEPSTELATTYLITGATRGIGLALVETLSARGDVRVIAGVRDAQHANAKALASKPNVSIVEIDSLRDDSAVQAAKKIEAEGVQAIDVVIANAGIEGAPVRASDTSADEYRKIFNVNTIAPVLLFSAFKPLLQRAATPRFSVTSSQVGSIQQQDETFNTFEVQDGQAKPQLASYAASKTAVNMLVRRIALEEPWLTAVPYHPGLVVTDMPRGAFGEGTMQGFLDRGEALTPEQSAKGIIKLAETAEQATHSGRFYDVQSGDFTAF